MERKILIVDDEPHIRMLLQQALEDLEDEGVQLVLARDGEEATQMIQTERPDLVFLDVMMPKKNGFDVCESVKSDAETKSTFIVLLTAKGQEFDRRRGLDVGADVFMTKPFDPDEILSRAREVLGM